MRRWRLVVLVGFAAFLAGSVPAQADGLLEGTDVVATATDDPVGTLTSTASESVGTASGAIGAATSAASGAASSTFGGANVVSQTPQGTTSSSAGPGSRGSAETSNRGRAAGSRGDRKAPGRSYHTRFDRLPRRAEVLLERIELGRNMRANLRRLEALLRRSPALRAELARALRSELARLRKGGLTHAERRQVRRLVRVQRALAPSASGPSSTLDSASALEGSGSLSPISGGESAATSPQNGTSQGDVAGAHAQREANQSGNGILGALPLPGVDRWPAWLMTLLDVVLWFCILALVAIFLSPFRRAFR